MWISKKTSRFCERKKERKKEKKKERKKQPPYLIKKILV
jgi:hypothetical protein